jgi:hypothetical protein
VSFAYLALGFSHTERDKRYQDSRELTSNTGSLAIAVNHGSAGDGPLNVQE